MKVTRDVVQKAAQQAKSAADRVNGLEARLDALEKAPKSTFWGRLRWLFIGR